MFLCMTHWPWVWHELMEIRFKTNGRTCKANYLRVFCNWNCIFWEEACDSFLSFRSFMYNQWRKMFLCSGGFNVPVSWDRQYQVASSFAVSWQPITDVLHIESNQNIMCEFAFVWSKHRFMSTMSLNCKNRWKTLQLNVLLQQKVIFTSLKKALAIRFVCLVYTSNGDPIQTL